MNNCLATLLIFAGMGSALAGPMEPDLHRRARSACRHDALSLCRHTVPDKKRTEACMRAKLDQLSPRCRAFFD